MSEALKMIYDSLDEQNADKSAATRRQLVAGAGAALGGMGCSGSPRTPTPPQHARRVTAWTRRSS